jgi:prepilin-type N-terminal cleavage/methylation domain-containing protein
MRRRGFSLVELLVVLGVIGLILGISVPSLTTYSSQLRLKAATRQIVGLLSLARSKAIGSRENHAVMVDQERREVSIVDLSTGEPMEQIVRLPKEVTVDVQAGGQSAAEPQVVFRPTGALEGRTMQLIVTGRDQAHTITITGTTGSVTVE